MRASSTVRMNFPWLRQLTQAQIKALEETAEALHTEVVQAQVIPFDSSNLQNNSTFVDYTNVQTGRAVLSSTAPYARRLYFHPEYHFDKGENPNARGKWYEDWLQGGKHQDFCQKAFVESYRRITEL